MGHDSPASVAQWANALAEPHCSEPGWLAQVAWVRLPLLPGMSSQVSACCEIILGQVQRVRLCPLTNVTGHHTRIGDVWVW